MKFRIYDKENNCYIENLHQWMMTHDGNLYNSEVDETYKIGDKFIVEYSSGRKDIFDKEIYAGDQVEFNTGYDFPVRCYVEYSERAYGFVLRAPSYGKDHTKLSGRGKLKIVGNKNINDDDCKS